MAQGNGMAYAIDPEARQLAAAAQAEIRAHAAVCARAEQDRDRRFIELAARMAEFQEHTKDTLRQIQKAYEEGQHQMTAIHATAMAGVRQAIHSHDEEDDRRFAAHDERFKDQAAICGKKFDGQGDVNKDLYSRFWACALGLIGLLLAVSAYLIIQVLHLH